MTESEFPTAFYCPITNEVMLDPYIDNEGNSYERKAIMEWLATNHSSPVTRSQLTINDLAPNRALRNIIEEEKQRRGIPVEVRVEDKPAVVPTAMEDDVNFVVTYDDSHIVATINPPAQPKGNSRGGKDIVCVIDVSGSMGEEATVQDDSGKSESHGLSMLDVVKHAVLTVSGMMNEEDRIALVSFNERATVNLELVAQTAEGKAVVEKSLNQMEADGRTNLWDGLQSAMNILTARKERTRVGSVMLLTDGMPNISPPRGHLPALQKYFAANNGGMGFTINTFGFGYALDSELLTELAVHGKGSYTFIPDSGLVGTVFINTTSCILGTAVTDVRINISGQGVETIKCSSTTPLWKEQTASVGSLMFGQPRKVLFKYDAATVDPSRLTAVMSYISGGSELSQKFVPQKEQNPDVNFAAVRARDIFVDSVTSAFWSMAEADQENATKSVSAAIGLIQKLSGELAQATVTDLTGQVSQAVSRADWFKKWGRHYLPSLSRAHQLELCNNFKDASVQLFTSPLFEQLRDNGEDVFLKIRPPKPSIRRPSGISQQQQVLNMAAYYNARGGCIHQDSLATMADGTQKPVSEVKKGDVFANGSIVRTVVTRPVLEGALPVVAVPGTTLMLTPYHPIVVDGEWVFPSDVAETKTRACTAVYNFVVDGCGAFTIDSVECAALGHGLTTNDVISHPYFGTERVIQDLMTLDGWASGCITLDDTVEDVRDPETFAVVGLRVAS